jgi:hypothetical protein
MARPSLLSLLIVGAAIWGFWLDPSASVVEKKIA